MKKTESVMGKCLIEVFMIEIEEPLNGADLRRTK